MTLLQLKYFQAVCKLGSISRATAKLHISQPAISAAIRELEREFGTQLFSRVGKSLQLTYEGQRLLDLSEDLLRQADGVHQVMADLANQRNCIRLGISPLLSSILLARIFQKLNSQYPEVTLLVEEGGRYPLFEKLKAGELDLVIMSEAESYIAPMENRYQKIPLTKLAYGCCVSPGHRLAEYSSVSIENVAREPLVTFQEGYHQLEFIDKVFADAMIEPNIAYQSSQLSTIWELVAHCGMTAFLYCALSRQRPDLRFIPFDPALDIQINLYWNSGNYLYSDINRFIRCVRELEF